METDYDRGATYAALEALVEVDFYMDDFLTEEQKNEVIRRLRNNFNAKGISTD